MHDIQSSLEIYELSDLFVSVCRFKEIVKKSKVEYHAGGATQNSIKIAQVSYVHTNNLPVSVTTSMLCKISKC